MQEILIDYFQGKLNYRERLELLRKVEEDEGLRDEFLKLEAVNAIVSLAKEPGDQEEGRLSYSDFIKKRKLEKTQRLLTSFLKYAAAIAVLVVTTVLTTLNLTKQSAPVIAENSVIVPAGQRAMIKLQDGTEVWLNAHSKIVYPSQFIGSERHVTISGEAYFRVAKNENMPFIVSTDNADIKVLGTTFNINSYPNSGFSQISLIEGALEVSNKGKVVTSITLKPDQQVTLKNNEFTLDQIRFHNQFLWIEGLYCFNNVPMADILKKLSVYFDVMIIVENKSISNISYTGKFRQTDGIDEILRILRKIQPFTVEKNPDGSIIRIK